MKEKAMKIVEELISENKKYEITVLKHNKTEKVVPINSNIENIHLFLELENEIVPSLKLQYSIRFEGDNYVRFLIFPSPTIINEKTRDEFVTFVNVANRYVLTGYGRFWVDLDHDDFAYELLLPAHYMMKKEEVRKQIFEHPLAHFTDLVIPLYMLESEKWKADKAIQFLTELRENGYVDHKNYDLW